MTIPPWPETMTEDAVKLPIDKLREHTEWLASNPGKLVDSTYLAKIMCDILQCLQYGDLRLSKMMGRVGMIEVEVRQQKGQINTLSQQTANSLADIHTLIGKLDVHGLQGCVRKLETHIMHSKMFAPRDPHFETRLHHVEKNIAFLTTALDLNSSLPKDFSCDHSPYRQHPCQAEDETPLSLGPETHPHRDSCNRETACQNTPETSHCTASDSSLSTLSHVRIAFHQTSILRESYVQLLSQILSSVLAQHGSSTLTDELLRVLSDLYSVPELVCRVEQREGHICILFLDDTHPKSCHSELALHQNFRSS